MPSSDTVFMFSGQGSQYFQMGRALFYGNNSFREWMVRLDEVVRQILGTSVLETLYADAHHKGDLFSRTLVTHPAIFMAEFSLARCLIEAGVRPNMVLGASLGSFAAAAVAGFLRVEDALTAVIRQAKAFEEYCEPGGMTAVLAAPALFEEGFMSHHSELAAVNFSSHFVVSGKCAELAAIEAVLSQLDIGFQRLAVSFPFHSQWIDKARAPFEFFMRSIRFQRPDLPLVCCDQMRSLSGMSADYFWNVVRKPIRFRETIAQLEQQGPRRYIDVGPAGTLATFLKYEMPPQSRSTIHSIMTPFGVDQKNLESLLASARQLAAAP